MAQEPILIEKRRTSWSIDDATDWLRTRFGKAVVPGLKEKFGDRQLNEDELNNAACEEFRRVNPEYCEQVRKSRETPFGYIHD